MDAGRIFFLHALSALETHRHEFGGMARLVEADQVLIRVLFKVSRAGEFRQATTHATGILAGGGWLKKDVNSRDPSVTDIEMRIE